MSIRFAAPIPQHYPVRRICSMDMELNAANDNPSANNCEKTLHAALRCFAVHGLAAADEARRMAEAAALRGEEQDFAWWRGICGALDRRMARELDRKRTSGI